MLINMGLISLKTSCGEQVAVKQNKFIRAQIEALFSLFVRYEANRIFI
jgi:hypothetical protein